MVFLKKLSVAVSACLAIAAALPLHANAAQVPAALLQRDAPVTFSFDLVALHGSSTTPFTIGPDGWTVIGSTPITNAGTCGTNGTANGSCYNYVSSSLGSDGATFTGTGTGTSLAISGVAGTILIGQNLTGNACVPANTTIVSGSGTSWVTSNATTCSGNSLSTTSNCTITSPCATLGRVFNRTQGRAGKPDHVNILCGDTIPFDAFAAATGRAFSFNAGGGISPKEPTVATTYCPGLPEGSGPRPTILSDCTKDGIQIGGYAAIINLRFYAHNRDPVNNPVEFDLSCQGSNNSSGFSKAGGAVPWILIEGSTFEYFNGNTVTADVAPNNTNNLILNRNIINGTYGSGFFSQGVNGGYQFTENIFCNSAWSIGAINPISSATYDSMTGLLTIVTNFASTAGYKVGVSSVISGVTGTGAASVNGTKTTVVGTAGTSSVFQLTTGLTITGLSGGTLTASPFGTSIQSHNWYFAQAPDYPSIPLHFPNATVLDQPITAPMVYKGNLSCYGANNDQLRQGGDVQFNVWLQDPGAISVAGNYVNFANNVITQAINYLISNAAYGNGMTTSTGATPNFTAPPSPALPQLIDSNIFTQNLGTGNSSTIFVQAPQCNTSNQNCTLPSTGWTVSNNIICDWPTTYITKQTEGAILGLDATSIVSGSGATPGIYPGTHLSNGTGTGAYAAVTIGPSGGVIKVDITQFGGVGAIFTVNVPGTNVATVTSLQPGGIILPNSAAGSWITTLLHTKVGTLNRTFQAQLTSTDPGGALGGNGTYQLDGTLTFSGGGTCGVLCGEAATSNPIQGSGYAVNNTLTIDGGNAINQIPGLSGATIKVSSVASNTYTNNTAQGTACSSLVATPPTATAYDTLIGGNGTVLDYVTRALGQSKSDINGKPQWFYKYSPYAMVNYFKIGFGLTPSAPVYAP